MCCLLKQNKKDRETKTHFWAIVSTAFTIPTRNSLVLYLNENNVTDLIDLFDDEEEYAEEALHSVREACVSLNVDADELVDELIEASAVEVQDKDGKEANIPADLHEEKEEAEPTVPVVDDTQPISEINQHNMRRDKLAEFFAKSRWSLVSTMPGRGRDLEFDWLLHDIGLGGNIKYVAT